MFLSMRYRVLITVLDLVVAVWWPGRSRRVRLGNELLVETHQDGPTIFYDDVDEEKGTRTQVFDGSPREAAAYMERRRSEGEDFLYQSRSSPPGRCC
jgi:hypothetical protein